MFVCYSQVFGFSSRIEAGLMPLSGPTNSPILGLEGEEAAANANEEPQQPKVMPTEAELETLAEKMLNGDYEEVLDALKDNNNSNNRPATTGMMKKVQHAAQVVAIASHLSAKSRGQSSSGKERLGEMIPVPAKPTKDVDPADRSFVSCLIDIELF